MFYLNIGRDVLREKKKKKVRGGGGTEDLTINTIFETKNGNRRNPVENYSARHFTLHLITLR